MTATLETVEVDGIRGIRSIIQGTGCKGEGFGIRMRVCIGGGIGMSCRCNMNCMGVACN